MYINMTGPMPGQVRELVVPDLEKSERFYRITSLTYSEDGNEILASYSSDYVYLFDLDVSVQLVNKIVSINFWRDMLIVNEIWLSLQGNAPMHDF